MDEAIKLSGAFTLRLLDEHGALLEERSVKNVITTVGKNFLAAWLASPSQSLPFMNYIAVGTGTTPANSADTTLGSELFRKQASVSSAGNVWSSQTLLVAGEGTGAITECGIFSASSVGTMLAHQVFAPQNKLASNQLQITWQVTFS